jgi:hypothetical protein
MGWAWPQPRAPGLGLKVAIGDMHEFLRIEGNTVFIPPAHATPVNRNAGVLALAIANDSLWS